MIPSHSMCGEGELAGTPIIWVPAISNTLMRRCRRSIGGSVTTWSQSRSRKRTGQSSQKLVLEHTPKLIAEESCQTKTHKRRQVMFIKKIIFRAAGTSVAAIISFAAQPTGAQTASQTERLEKLERAVEQLQQRNAELEAEVRSLKKHTAAAPEDKMKTKVTYDGKSYIEKEVVKEEKAPLYVLHRGPELKLVLGGFIQANFEGGDVSAFEGRFGQTALDDRFRLRRARVNLTGDFAEQFDFKVEGDFGQGDGLNSNRTAFSATDIFVNWHQFPEAQIKVGQWKAPFGLEQLTPDTTLYLAERSLPTGAITPDRQIGAQLWGKPFTTVWPEQKDLLTYYAGVFNGNGRNTSINDNNSFMYVGRLELTPFKGKIFGQDS